MSSKYQRVVYDIWDPTGKEEYTHDDISLVIDMVLWDGLYRAVRPNVVLSIRYPIQDALVDYVTTI